MSPKTQIQTLSILLIFMLLIAGLGIYRESFISQNFPLVKTLVFLASLVFLGISWQGRKKFWIAVFLAILVVLNPFYALISFTAISLKISYLITALIFALFVLSYYSTYRKGALFEKFVADRFPDGIWTIVSRSEDYSRKFGRVVESDQNPDFTFRNNTSGNKIAVECKYRSYFYQGGIEIHKDQVESYKNYAQKEDIPVYIFIGVGNSPQNPAQLFVVPLDKAEALFNPDSGIIAKESLSQFEVGSKKEFINL